MRSYNKLQKKKNGVEINNGDSQRYCIYINIIIIITNYQMHQTQHKDKQKQAREVEKIVRYHENQFPKEDQLVMVQCESCQQNGSYVELLQYERKKAMVPLSEYTQSMKKNIKRAMKVGKVQVAKVTKVDMNKGYIDLSKSKVSPQDENICQQKFAKTKALHSIVINITKDQNQVNNIYKNIIWPMYRQHPNVHPHDLIKQILLKEDKAEEYGFKDQKLKADLISELKRRYKKPVVKSMAVFKVSVTKLFDGIVKLKEILKSGVDECKLKDYDVKITILGAPDYLAQISTPTKEQGQQILMIALNKIKQQATKVNGQFQIKQKPKVVGDTNHALHQIMAQVDLQDEINDDDQMGDQDQI